MTLAWVVASLAWYSPKAAKAAVVKHFVDCPLIIYQGEIKNWGQDISGSPLSAAEDRTRDEDVESI